MTEFVGEFEPLDQAIAKLFVGWLALMARQALSRAGDGVHQRRDVERRRGRSMRCLRPRPAA